MPTPARGDGAAARTLRIPAALLAALLLVAGCEGGADAPADPAGDTVPLPGEAAGEAAVEAAAVDGLAVLDPWVRVAIMPDPDPAGDAPPVNSAAYMVLRNATGQADALVAVESALADTVELHTVSMDGGIMRMRAVEEVAVPGRGEAVLAPGGFHIMLIGLHGPLVEGDTAGLTLRFRSGRTLDLTAPIRRSPPR